MSDLYPFGDGGTNSKAIIPDGVGHEARRLARRFPDTRTTPAPRLRVPEPDSEGNV